MALWVCPPAQWGGFVCESGRTMPFGCAPLPDGDVDRRLGLSTSDGAVDRSIGLLTSECTKVLHAVEPGSCASYRRPANLILRE